MTYFPFETYWWLYAGFLALVAMLLALDLGVFHRKPHAVGFVEAAKWSALWVGLALAFNVGLVYFAGWALANDSRFAGTAGFSAQAVATQMGWDFLAGYLVEKALSLDNIFVFVVIFGYFGIPAVQQHRILYYGILGAVAMRGALIAAGSALLQYEWALILFGVFLILTGVKMAVLPTKAGGPEDNLLVRWVKAWLPVTPTLHGDRFLVRMGGVWHATPLLLALAVIEMSDLIFAVDSVPAIFGLTHEPLVVFTSNVFAILGLRSLYFLLAEAVQRFQLLKYGLAAILVFVGLKMAWLNGAMGGKFPATWSLGIIATILAGATLASMVTSRRAVAIPGATRVRT